jgi:hypothetical protein
MVGNWLYGVAYRTALKAKVVAAKRRTRERQVTELPDVEAPQPDTWRDLRPLLDRELSRLPDKYRVPLILCGLEGKTEKEAARQLGWPQGTLSGRLSRAKAMLAKRLARRGLVLSAGSLTAIMAHEAASACAPAPLLVSTVKAAKLFAAREAPATGLISVEVASLTRGVLTAMFWYKVKVATAVLVAAAVVVSGSGILMSRAGGPDTPDRKSQASAPDDQERKVAPKESTSKKDDHVTTSPAEIADAFQTNAALADEKFTGKRVRVKGKVLRIKWGAVASPQPGNAKTARQKTYDLLMLTEAPNSFVDREGVIRYKSVSGPALPVPNIRCQFFESDRKDLAQLKAGQEVIIEGRPEFNPSDYTISFLNCKIIKPIADD